MDTFPDSSDPFAQSAEHEMLDEPMNKDIPLLFSRWQNEKYAPELLPYETTLVENINDLLEFVANSFREEGGIDADSPEPTDVTYRFRRIDYERVKYLLRDYLRIRIWKLCQYPQHYLEAAHTVYLSDAERRYLRDYWENKYTFLENRVLSQLPTSKNTLDPAMVRRPALDKHVFVKAIKEVVGRSGTQQASATQSSANRNDLTLAPGVTVLTKYSLIRRYLMEAEHSASLELV